MADRWCPWLLSALLLLAVRDVVHAVNIEPYKPLILMIHNFYRRQESAADMKELTWDPYLQRRAEEWANHCNWKHQGRGLGENLAYFWTNGPQLKSSDVIVRSARNWWKEVHSWDWSTTCGAACHYTQMIWAKTERVGCALKTCSSMRNVGDRRLNNANYFVCFYDPPGNFIGRYPYKQGEACSMCDYGETCNSGLCSKPTIDIRPAKKWEPQYRTVVSVGSNNPPYKRVAQSKGNSPWDVRQPKKKSPWDVAQPKKKSLWDVGQPQKKSPWDVAQPKKKSPWDVGQPKKKSPLDDAQLKKKSLWDVAQPKKKSPWDVGQPEKKSPWDVGQPQKKSPWDVGQPKKKSPWDVVSTGNTYSTNRHVAPSSNRQSRYSYSSVTSNNDGLLVYVVRQNNNNPAQSRSAHIPTSLVPASNYNPWSVRNRWMSANSEPHSESLVPEEPATHLGYNAHVAGNQAYRHRGREPGEEASERQGIPEQGEAL